MYLISTKGALRGPMNNQPTIQSTLFIALVLHSSQMILFRLDIYEDKELLFRYYRIWPPLAGQ